MACSMSYSFVGQSEPVAFVDLWFAPALDHAVRPLDGDAVLRAVAVQGRITVIGKGHLPTLRMPFQVGDRGDDAVRPELDVIIGQQHIFAAGRAGLEEFGQRALGALGAGLPEHLADPVVGFRGHHHALGGDGLVTADQGEEGVADSAQLFAQRAFAVGHEQVVGHHFHALGLDRLEKQRLLVAEMAVDGEFGNAGAGGDAVHAHAVETLFDEHFLGRFQDRGTLAQVLGAAGTGAARGRLAGGVGRMMRRHQTILGQLVRYLYYTGSFSNGAEPPTFPLIPFLTCDPHP